MGEPFRRPLVDRLTLRLLNLRQITPGDFEGSAKGLRLREEPIKRYFELYEEQLRDPSECQGSPTWRQRLTDQVEALRDMVMAGEVRRSTPGLAEETGARLDTRLFLEIR